MPDAILIYRPANLSYFSNVQIKPLPGSGP